MAKKVQWATLIADVRGLQKDYDDNDISFIAIKHELKFGTAKVYLNTVLRAQDGELLKGNYNQLFLEEMRKAGFVFQVKTNKPHAKTQPEMGLMDYAITGDIDSLHEQIKSLTVERDFYQKKYSGLVRSIEFIHKANPAIV